MWSRGFLVGLWLLLPTHAFVGPQPTLRVELRLWDRKNDQNPQPPSNRNTLAASAFTSLIGTTSAAQFDLIPGYDKHFLTQDIAVTLLTGVLGYVYVYAIQRFVTDSKDARKLIHFGSAPLYMIFWPLFSHPSFCAIVPLLNGIRLLSAGLGQEAGLAAAVSRSGDVREALGGPFLYCIILFSTILLFWKTPIAILSLSCLAAGDGMADLVGRRYGKRSPWKFVPNKSVAGSLAFVLASTLCGIALMSWMNAWGWGPAVLVDDWILRVLAVAGVAAAVELLPWLNDNITVPLAAGIMTQYLFH